MTQKNFKIIASVFINKLSSTFRTIVSLTFQNFEFDFKDRTTIFYSYYRNDRIINRNIIGK